jgi:excisionase family DNA binding protein
MSSPASNAIQLAPLPPDEPDQPAGTTLWTSDDVAAFLRVSTSWVRHRVAAGKLPHLRIGGWMVRFDPDEIRAWATKPARR